VRRLILFIAILMGLIAPVEAPAQNWKPIYDGRLILKQTRPSSSEGILMQESVLPAARKTWHEQESDRLCTAGFEAAAIDIVRGSFTRPESDQKAILYRYCETGNNMALNGIAVIENAQVVAHVLYEGGWDNAIGALPDINGNGLSEIVVATGGTNMGETWEAISIIEVSGSGVMKFGQTKTRSDNCGADEKHGKAEACRLSVKVGSTPIVCRETFVNDGFCGGTGKWRKSGDQKQISLEEDEIEYELIK